MDLNQNHNYENDIIGEMDFNISKDCSVTVKLHQGRNEIKTVIEITQTPNHAKVDSLNSQLFKITKHCMVALEKVLDKDDDKRNYPLTLE